MRMQVDLSELPPELLMKVLKGPSGFDMRAIGDDQGWPGGEGEEDPLAGMSEEEIMLMLQSMAGNGRGWAGGGRRGKGRGSTRQKPRFRTNQTSMKLSGELPSRKPKQMPVQGRRNAVRTDADDQRAETDLLGSKLEVGVLMSGNSSSSEDSVEHVLDGLQVPPQPAPLSKIPGDSQATVDRATGRRWIEVAAFPSLKG